MTGTYPAACWRATIASNKGIVARNCNELGHRVSFIHSSAQRVCSGLRRSFRTIAIGADIASVCDLFLCRNVGVSNGFFKNNFLPPGFDCRRRLYQPKPGV